MIKRLTAKNMLATRIAKGLHQRDIAEAAGVSCSTVGNWEHGRLSPTRAQGKAVKEALNGEPEPVNPVAVAVAETEPEKATAVEAAPDVPFGYYDRIQMATRILPSVISKNKDGKSAAREVAYIVNETFRRIVKEAK